MSELRSNDEPTKWRTFETVEAELVEARAEVSQQKEMLDEFSALLHDARAKIEAAMEHERADTCQSVLSPDAGYPCNCWRAALAEPLGSTPDPPAEGRSE